MSYKPRHAKPSRTKQRVSLVASSGAVAASIALAPGQAHAAEAPNLSSTVPALPSPQDIARQLDQQSRDWVWANRNALQQQAGNLPPGSSDQARQAIDGAVNSIYPGLIEERSGAAAQPAPAPAAPNNPCPADAKACVDLGAQQSWLQEDGTIVYGKVPISSGRAGSETPKGYHTVTRKVRDEISYEFNNAPMPYSVYFTAGGVAFHQDDVNVPSAGCVHLNHQDAVHYFDTLNVGDVVYVF
ncbi:L,D-transpeptidase [Corynebacterium uropygiale]|uniref:L,D-transpeptidase n=1 Tax=Corynebacterium uropygiale TaxID=1775911 RepID=A0A9X1U6Q5_9CORY|nr:L,D-transpeptidase [Corynebacterium uropygiale]MCF4005932.1 L,D-transpeptidase [Corynebacterium uropygiale]